MILVINLSSIKRKKFKKKKKSLKKKKKKKTQTEYMKEYSEYMVKIWYLYSLIIFIINYCYH